MPFRFNPITNKLDLVDVTTVPVNVPQNFDTDVGIAVPVANTIKILGGFGIQTSGVGDTVTITNLGGGTTWNLINANQFLVSGEAYFVDTTLGNVTLTLPPVSVLGDYFRIYNLGPNNVVIGQGIGQQTRLGQQLSTIGVLGSFTTTQPGDALEIVCSVANTNFNIVSVIGNISFN